MKEIFSYQKYNLSIKVGQKIILSSRVRQTHINRVWQNVYRKEEARRNQNRSSEFFKQSMKIIWKFYKILYFVTQSDLNQIQSSEPNKNLYWTEVKRKSIASNRVRQNLFGAVMSDKNQIRASDSEKTYTYKT